MQVFLLCNVLQGDRQVRDIPARPQVQSLRMKSLQWDSRGPVLLCPRPEGGVHKNMEIFHDFCH